MSYAFFKQVLPPTGVEHCIKANLTAPDAVNLIVAKTSVLDVYTLKRGGNQADYILELVVSHSLFGNIESLVAVRFPGHARDAILLSFRDAKVYVSCYLQGSCSFRFLFWNSVLSLTIYMYCRYTAMNKISLRYPM